MSTVSPEVGSLFLGGDVQFGDEGELARVIDSVDHGAATMPLEKNTI